MCGNDGVSAGTTRVMCGNNAGECGNDEGGCGNDEGECGNDGESNLLRTGCNPCRKSKWNPIPRNAVLVYLGVLYWFQVHREKRTHRIANQEWDWTLASRKRS